MNMSPARSRQAAGSDLQEAPPASLDASDEFDPVERGRYCPTELLARFTLLMAGHGRCVSSAMMLGDREYALWQVACAQGMGDEELRLAAARLFAWLDEANPLAAR